jgi:hypothetical protein
MFGAGIRKKYEDKSEGIDTQREFMNDFIRKLVAIKINN